MVRPYRYSARVETRTAIIDGNLADFRAGVRPSSPVEDDRDGNIYVFPSENTGLA